MAYVFRFMTNLRSQKKHVDQLTVNELERAERYIIKRVHSDYFHEEIAYLHETNKKQTKVPQYVSQFGLCLDENQILRCKSRLHNAQISYQEKNPILINGESHLAKLIIAESHNAVFSQWNCTNSLPYRKEILDSSGTAISKRVYSSVLCL